MPLQTGARPDETTTSEGVRAIVSRRRGRGRFVFASVAVALAAATVAVLVIELRHTDIRTTVSHIRVPYLCLGVAAIAVSIVAAAYNLIGFAPLRLRLGRTLLAQLAVSAIRVVAPSAVSTPTIAARYLIRSGARAPDALAAVGVAQTVQFIVTVALVGGLDIASSWNVVFVRSSGLGIAVGAALGLYLLGWLSIRRSARAAHVADSARQSLTAVIKRVRSRPGVAAAGFIASAALTVSHVAAFVFCVRAAGGHASLATLTSVYLVAIAAGSVIPTPGGTGAVEAAMITGLTVAGVPLSPATAATIVFRFISVWMLVPPGWLALFALRRTRLL